MVVQAVGLSLGVAERVVVAWAVPRGVAVVWVAPRAVGIAPVPVAPPCKAVERVSAAAVVPRDLPGALLGPVMHWPYLK